MVNIPLETMDDYGVLEPTDVGNMTIDYDSKDDSKIKRFRWDHEEVMCMLNLIKENKFASQYSAMKMAGFLSQLLAKKGWNRTQRQIHVKLITLRKHYLSYERLKLADTTMKECPFYKELREIYRESNGGIEVEEYDSNSQDESIIKFPNDPVDWSKEEVQKMLNIIKSMKLKNELTLTFFSPVAVRMTAEAMHQAGFDRSTEQVKNALINLRTMYVDYKIGCDSNENPSECLFFPCLDFFWAREYKKHRLKEKKKLKTDDFWTTEETVLLLTLIGDLKIADEAYENTEKAAESLKQRLSEENFHRSKQQIMDKLEQLKLHFVSVHEKCAQGDVLRRFPFYNLYKKLFEQQILPKNLSKNSQNRAAENNNIIQKTKEKSPKQVLIWSNDEVKLLLKTVKELTWKSQFNDSLEDEKLKKLMEVFSEEGYSKTSEQLKRKLALLKDSYLKCDHQNEFEKNVLECPFYNELHDIFKTPDSDKKHEFIQSILSESYDSSSSRYSDHCYIKFSNFSDSPNNKVTVIPNNTWFPGESVVEEEVVTSNHFDEVPSLSHQQTVEEKVQSMLSDQKNVKVQDEAEIVLFSEKDNIVVNSKEVPVSNNVATVTEKVTKSCDATKNQSDSFNKNLESILPKDSVRKSSVNNDDDDNDDDDEEPTSKKPKFIEDEKLSKKYLLRPVDMNPSVLNVSNNKFVRLIVANDQSHKKKINQISAHIEPLSINSVSSGSSGMSSPGEKTDILKLAAETTLSKDDFEEHEHLKKKNFKSSSFETVISETIKDAVLSMMKHNELLQQRHQEWMKKQFEQQQKHDTEQRNILMNELKELRSVVSVLLDNNKQPQSDSKNP